MLGILPSLVFRSHTVSARAISQATRLCFRSKENPVFWFHSFARSAVHRTINFKPGIAAKPNLFGIEQLLEFSAAGKSLIAQFQMPDHLAS